MNVLSLSNSVVATTDDLTLDSGSIVNATSALSVSFTIVNSGDESMDYVIVAGNTSDLSDAVVVQSSAELASGAVGSYAVQVAPFLYYGVQVGSAAPSTPSEATIKGRAKG